MKGLALYAGVVRHARLGPARHKFEYRGFMGLFDLDAQDDSANWAFRYNRPGLISFYDRDHGDGSGRPLRPQIEAQLATIGVALDGGAIHLLCMPRVLNYVFNPLSVYFCYDRVARLRAIVHEVNNTFGERHFYALPAEPDARGVFTQRCVKTFRVSPLLPMDLRYRFRIHAPDERVSIAINVDRESGPILTASFSGVRRAFTGAAILRALVAHPALTLKVVAAIHWEAARIWLKIRWVGRRPVAAETRALRS